MVELGGLAGAGGCDRLIAGSVLLTNSLSHGRFFRSYHAEPGNHIPPDLVVVVSDGSKVFHVAGCPFIHDKASERTITAKEAMRDGYVPCTRCLRQYLKTGLSGRPGAEVAEERVRRTKAEVLVPGTRSLAMYGLACTESGKFVCSLCRISFLYRTSTAQSSFTVSINMPSGSSDTFRCPGPYAPAGLGST